MDPANQNGNGNGAAGGTPPAGDPNINNNGTPPQNGGQPPANGSTPPASNGGNGAGDGAGSGVQLTDEQLAAAFNHPRFKSLNEKAKKADELQAAADKSAADALAAQGKFEDLYKSAEERAKTAETSLKQERVNNAVVAAAAKLGVVDPAAAVKLLDQSNITVSEDGTISGVDDAVKALQTASPYLFKTPAQSSMGSGSNPPNGGNTQSEFTYSQVQDIAFYKANQAAVDKAMAEGRIDMSK